MTRKHGRALSSGPSGRAPFSGLIVVSLGASLAAMDLAVNVAFPFVPKLVRRLRSHGIAARVITVSDFNVAFLRRQFDSAAHRVSRLYNGIDLERFPFSSPRVRPPGRVSRYCLTGCGRS